MSSCCVENNLVETPTTPTSPTTNDVFIDDDGFSTKEPVLGHSKIKDSIKYNKEKMKHVNKKKTSSNGSNNNNNKNSQSQLTESVSEEGESEERKDL